MPSMNVFTSKKSQRIFFLSELLQPYYCNSQHHFPQLDNFPTLVLQNDSLKKLYQLTIDNLNIHNMPDSIFFCDKLLTLTNYHIAAVYLMGECFYRNGDLKKVHSLFQAQRVLNHSISFQLLAAKALLQNKQYDSCLGVLEMQMQKVYFNSKMESAKLFVKAQCYEAQENKILAIQNYIDCLKKDVTNVQAFNRLIDSQLISGVQKDHLLSNLIFNDDEIWLKKLYFSKIKPIEKGPLPAPFAVDEDIRRDNIFDALSVKQNVSLLCTQAKIYHQNYQIPAAEQICRKVIRKDPLCFEIIPVYAACLLDQGSTSELYYCAHNLVENYANHPVSWFTVGTYYFHCKKFQVARKYFQKAIMLDKGFPYAWIGMAHSFAVQDESDQAMSIYRTIVRLFPGCAQAHLYMGMEYLRTNNLKTATLSLMKARQISPTDPLIYSQLGVIYYKQRNYKEAKDLQLKALAFCQPETSFWVMESILTNLAHTYRKLKDYHNAIKYFEQCVSLNANNPQTYFSLAFVYHLSSQLNKAICYYHKSLKFKHDNQFAQQMLQKALNEASELPWDSVYNI